MRRETDDLLLFLGYVLGALESDDLGAAFLRVLCSDEEGRDRVWRYTQRLRDRLTELLQEAGRE